MHCQYLSLLFYTLLWVYTLKVYNHQDRDATETLYSSSEASSIIFKKGTKCIVIRNSFLYHSILMTFFSPIAMSNTCRWILWHALLCDNPKNFPSSIWLDANWKGYTNQGKDFRKQHIIWYLFDTTIMKKVLKWIKCTLLTLSSNIGVVLWKVY